MYSVSCSLFCSPWLVIFHCGTPSQRGLLSHTHDTFRVCIYSQTLRVCLCYDNSLFLLLPPGELLSFTVWHTVVPCLQIQCISICGLHGLGQFECILNRFLIKLYVCAPTTLVGMDFCIAASVISLAAKKCSIILKYSSHS